MAQVNTQDNQKVFNSALEKFSSFNGGVENVSSSKNMQDIYDNMTKLFDVFTQGALKEQGANSEILLRNVYRSLSDDFLKIIQDTKAVEKIAEVIKGKQDSIKPEEADKAMVSETTKKVVTKTLDPNDCDPMSVILDFTDELQTAILQVKLNLSREYERQKLAHAKSIEGQQEDLDRLNKEFQEQNDTMVSVLEDMSKVQTENKDEDLEQFEELLKKFDIIPDDAYVKDEAGKISSDLDQVGKSLAKVKFNPQKVAKSIKSPTKKVVSKPKVEAKKPEPAKVEPPKKVETPTPTVKKQEVSKPEQKSEVKKLEQKPEAKKPEVQKPEAKKPPQKTQETKTPPEVKKPEPKPTVPQKPAPKKEESKKPPEPVKPLIVEKPAEKKVERAGKTPTASKETPVKEVSSQEPPKESPPQVTTEVKEETTVVTQEKVVQEPVPENVKDIPTPVQKPPAKVVPPSPIKSNFKDLKSLVSEFFAKIVPPPVAQKVPPKKTVSPLKVAPPKVMKAPLLKFKKAAQKPVPVKAPPMKMAPAKLPLKLIKPPSAMKSMSVVKTPLVKSPPPIMPSSPLKPKSISSLKLPSFKKPPVLKHMAPPPMNKLSPMKVRAPIKVAKKPSPLRLKTVPLKKAAPKPIKVAKKPPLVLKKLPPAPPARKMAFKKLAKSAPYGKLAPMAKKAPIMPKMKMGKLPAFKNMARLMPPPKAMKAPVKGGKIPTPRKKVLKSPRVLKKPSLKQAKSSPLKPLSRNVPKSPLPKAKMTKPKVKVQKMVKTISSTSAPKKHGKKEAPVTKGKKLSKVQKPAKVNKPKGKAATKAKPSKAGTQIAGLSKMLSGGLASTKSGKGLGKKLGKKVALPGKKGKITTGGMIQNMFSGGGKTGKKNLKNAGKLSPKTPMKSKAPATKGSKLGGKPNGKTCTCPLCGNVHQHGKTAPQKKKLQPKIGRKSKKSPEPQGNGNDIQSDKVQETLGIFGNNVSKLVRDKKFRRNFEIKYKPIQKQIQKTMSQNDADEAEAHSNFEKTKDNIKKLKNKKGSPSLLQMMMNLGNLFSIVWIVLGGLLIIGLLRKGWQMWKAAYMPKVKSDPVTFTVFGFKIPVAGEIVDAFTAIKNFITVGLPNWWTRISTTFEELYENLFGKDGHFRDLAQIKATMWRLVAAWFVGQTKQAVGTVAKWLGKVLAFIPFVGPILQFLCELIPEVYAFVVNRIMKEWANKQAEAERHEKKAKKVQQLSQQSAGKKIKGMISELLKKSAKIKPIVPPEAIPHMQTPKKPGKVRKPMSIMRHVQIKNYHSGAGSAYDTNAVKSHQDDLKKWGGITYLTDSKKIIGFSVGENQKEGSEHYERVKNDVLSEDSNMEGKTLFQKLLIFARQPWNATKRARAKKMVAPETNRLSAYMAKLGRALEAKYKRVGDEVLYHPDKGWNPSLRITKADLVTRIPFTPYSEMVDSGIGYGAEAVAEDKLPGGEGYGKGYMPFKWMWNGGVIVRDPMEWELRRARNAFRRWNDLAELVSGPSQWWSGATLSPEQLIKTVLGDYSGVVSEADLQKANLHLGDDDWRLQNGFMQSWANAANPYAYNPMSSKDYNGNYSKGLFPTYYELMRQGRWNSEGFKTGNILRMAKITKVFDEDDMKVLDKTKGLSTDESNGAVLGDESKMWQNRFLIDDEQSGFSTKNFELVNYTVAQYNGKDGKINDVRLGETNDSQWKMWKDEGWEDIFKMEGRGPKERERNRVQMRIYAGELLSGNVYTDKKMGEAYNKMALPRLEAHLNAEYAMKSDGRKFKFGEFLRVIKGAALGRMYRNAGNGVYTVSNPIMKAGNLLARMTHDVFFIPKYDGQPAGKDHFYSFLHHLIDFLHLRNAKGSTKKDVFEQFNTDVPSKTAISRLILQYFKKVWFQWGLIEKALQVSMLKMDGKSYADFKKAFANLGEMFDMKNLLGYVASHVRLPNVKINVVDYLNATKEQLPMVDKYRKEANLKTMQEKYTNLKLLDNELQIAIATSKHKSGLLQFSPKSVTDAMKRIVAEIKKAEWEYKYTGDPWYRDALLDKYGEFEDFANTMGILVEGDAKITERPDGYVKTIGVKLSPDERRKRMLEEQRKRKAEAEKRKLEEAARRRAKQKQLAARREKLAVKEAENQMLEKLRKDEENYQAILNRLVSGTHVSDDEMNKLGKEVENVKQEAENKIQSLPREERDLRLALIRGDKVSPKTFTELQATASGLQTSLQDYMMEVRKIPTGSLVGIQSVPTGQTKTVNTQDTDAVDLAS